jgi:deoxyadenosine/deoxycytidine kinase
MRYKFLAVEGPIGVGKTSLVHRLGEKFNAREFFENVENPFLEAFYDDRPGAAFQAQLFFLLNRYQQQKDLAQTDLFHQLTIADYLFAKDKIFAYLNLSDSELIVYERLYGLLEANLPGPDLVIYLQASTDVLVDRIRKRRRDVESRISEVYIDEVNKAYNHFFFHYDATPLLVIDTTDIDFVQREADMNDLVARIQSMERGVHYYVPLGSRK